ncbi:MAG TPA: hypothetical protein VFR02_09730 [bacterium]|nr:hypothetical protein [bacterium]
MTLKQDKPMELQNPWTPTRADLAEAFQAALKPFGDLTVMPIDSFNVKASSLFLDRFYRSASTGMALGLRCAQDLAGILSDGTRLEGQALLSPLEALDHLAARFARQLQDRAQARGAFFPLDWDRRDPDPQGEPAAAGRLLASLSLVEIKLWQTKF